MDLFLGKCTQSQLFANCITPFLSALKFFRNPPKNCGMIPPKTFRALRFATNIGWKSGAIPYRFIKRHDSQQGDIVQPSFTTWRNLFVWLSFTINCVYISFILFRVFEKAVVLENEHMSIDFLVQMGYLFLCYTMPVVIQINTFLMWEEAPAFCIRYINFFRHIKDAYMLPGEKGPRCIKFFSAVIIIGVLVNLQNIIIIVKYPSRVHFFTSLFPDPFHVPIYFRAPVLMIQAWIWINTWANVWIFCFHLYVYASCMVYTVRELDWKVKGAKTSKSLRSMKIFLKSVRSMQVLHRFFQHNFQTWFLPAHKAVAISVGSLGTYGVIKLAGPRSLVMGCTGLLATLYLAVLFRKFGKLHDLSTRMFENWTHSSKSTRWMRKFLRSVPVFRVDIGSFYYVKKTTVIAVLFGVLNNTVTLLLF